MDVGIYQGAAALTSLERWQAVISQNIASASVPGFKESQLSIHGMDYGSIQDRAHGASQPAVMPVSTGSVSFQSGEMSRTGNPTDAAIGGSGFFVVQEASGNTRYTRNGEFNINPSNQLTTSTGELVQGAGGPITLLPNSGPVSIDPTGQVYQGNQLISKLKIVDFPDTSKLTKTTGGFYAPSDAQPTPNTSSTISQGYLEGSNVSAISEMVQLIQVNRAFEANQKVLSSLDSRLQRVIQTFNT